MERVRNSVLIAAIAAIAVAAGGCLGEVPGGVNDPSCVLDGADGENERSPGYPYDFDVFKRDIAPLLVADCVTGACHASAPRPAGGNGGFTVYAGEDEECSRVQTFKQLRDKVDLTRPAESRILYALEGGALTSDIPHPLDYTAVDGGQAKLDTITAFISAANETCVAGGGCSPDVRDYFDYAAFQSSIQPGLDAAGGTGCSTGVSCHQPPAGQSGFALIPEPAADSADMKANYDAVRSRISLDADPRATLLYAKATVPHAGGVSTVVDGDTAEAIEAWIEAAIRARGEGDDLGCVNPAKLDLDVFEDDILPILNGERDLNDPEGTGVSTGCTRGPCHGQQRPGSLTLDPGDPLETQLANFACFVSLTSPSSSQVLICPRKDARCVKNPHPGERIFDDAADDLNYQRVLSYLFSSVTEATPIDFAFYARRINPIFDNQEAVEGGGQGRTCADVGLCHGVPLEDQVPPNGSNFGILPVAGENVNRLRANYTEACSFINFIRPELSSLFLYPTNEIANPDNPGSLGIVHAGGTDFAIDSRFALDIQTFARGLRPDAEGFQRNWLVGGAFQGAGDIDDEVGVDEDAARPQIFDLSGGGELAGKWDGLFDDEAEVDVGGFLRGEVGGGRIAYAVAYLVNVTSAPREVDVELTSINQARILAGDGIAEIEPGGTVTVTVTVPSSRASEQPTGTRVLVKLLEAPADGGMRFRVRLLRAGTDDIYDDEGGEIIIKLGPLGGI